jgi:hypothetical protein
MQDGRMKQWGQDFWRLTHLHHLTCLILSFILLSFERDYYQYFGDKSSSKSSVFRMFVFLIDNKQRGLFVRKDGMLLSKLPAKRSMV